MNKQSSYVYLVHPSQVAICRMFNVALIFSVLDRQLCLLLQGFVCAVYYVSSLLRRVPKACYRSGSTAGGTPQRSWVRSPSGANFSSGVKKTPSLVPRPKHCGARPNSQGDGPPCTGGAGVRGFSWPAVRRSFYLSNNAVGAVSPPAGQVFYNAGYGWIQSLTLIDTYSTYLGVILIPYFYGPQALEIQGKRPEALDELLKICRIHNMFPPEDNSVCIWLQNLKACLLALLFLLHLLLFQPISLVV